MSDIIIRLTPSEAKSVRVLLAAAVVTPPDPTVDHETVRALARINVDLVAVISKIDDELARGDRPAQPYLPKVGNGARIVKTPGVCGGSARVDGTRIAVWLLELLRRDGRTSDDLLISYPGLSRDDIAEAWMYAVAHKSEIDSEIADEATS